MAGIPKAGDMTPLVALLGLYVFLLKTNGREEAEEGVGGEQPYASPQSSRSAWGPLMARAVLVFVLVVTLGVVTWMKGVNYARADAIAANANKLFAGGDSRAGVMTALRATTLAPDVQSYYRQASRMFDMLASDAVSADSKQRWALGAYTFGRQAADANGLDPAARAALASKAISLGLLGEAGRFEEAVELYEGVVAMSPRFATVRYAAASAMLLAGDPEAALHELDAGDTLLNQAERRPSVAAQGAYLRGIARRQQRRHWRGGPAVPGAQPDPGTSWPVCRGRSSDSCRAVRGSGRLRQGGRAPGGRGVDLL